MLGLTYIFPDEPIEPDELIVVGDYLHHPLIKRVMAQTLRERGFKWDGEYSAAIFLPEPVGNIMRCGRIQFGTMGPVGNPQTDLLEDFDSAFSQYRINTYGHLWHIKLARVQSSSSNRNVWFEFNITNELTESGAWIHRVNV